MSAREMLTAELRAEVRQLEGDLRQRVTTLANVEQAWRAEYNTARAVERTSAAWEEWVDERVTLAAVAWVLTTVFIRFCEDNALVKPVWISGPRSREAVEAQQQFLRETARANPDVTDREWLLHAVEYLESLPATAGLVDSTSPMWLVSPSGDAATRLLNYWRERDEEGRLRRDLSDPELDTRFLGDLYQDISEEAKKRYALLQTPVFVEEFILDRTLEPALDERPLAGFKMIDPTCGSGHFLLGGFRRLLDRWHRHAPAMDERERVQTALDSVYGVDINPFAVAIARFRLTVAALRASGLLGLEGVPAFKYHLAVGDSLLHGLAQPELNLGPSYSADQVAANFAYATENLDALRSILRNGQYDVVVGNPPYITVKDAALNKLYRERYSTCYRVYALTAPFMERFYSLAHGDPKAGWTGQITSNSFMKREFGAPLIERFLVTKDLRFVIDSEGVWMPGHNMDGTPTVIIIGRNARPVRSTVKAVLSKTLRETPNDTNGSGPYWRAILEHLDDDFYDSDWVTITELDRSMLAKHPWSLTGGGSVDLVRAIELGAPCRLSDLGASVGRTTVVGEDGAWFVGPRDIASYAKNGRVMPLVTGDIVRDFRIAVDTYVWSPYTDILGPKWISPTDPLVTRTLWPMRTLLRNRSVFGKGLEENNRPWYDHLETYRSKLRTPLSICVAFIASHNHVALDRGGKLFKQSAPIVKLPDGATLETYQSLLGTLSTSVVCFWLKQKSQPKGGAAGIPWSRTYEFSATTVEAAPIPSSHARSLGAAIDTSMHAIELYEQSIADAVPSRELLEDRRSRRQATRRAAISLQEELDWSAYRLYGLIEEDLVYHGDDLPSLSLGERAFEILLARRVAAGGDDTSWFEQHGSTPIVDFPADWPDAYGRVVARRIELAESHPFIALLERPENKRRWAAEPWNELEERVVRTWLLDRLENRTFWFDTQGRPVPKSVAVLADAVARDPDATAVLTLWEGRPDVPISTSLQRLLTGEAIPFLAAFRYEESGLRKRASWAGTWELQRREDAGTYNPAPLDKGGDGPIPVPPKYTAANFRRPGYWTHRGPVDVPKERFILYPNAGREGDPSPVIGWAGWDHAQQSLALATLIQIGEQQDWDEETRLKPLVAGLEELLPWVEQWHHEPEPLYGGSPAEFFNGILEAQMAKLGVTRGELRAWRPPAPARSRRVRA